MASCVASTPLDSKKFAKNQEKEGKSGKNHEKKRNNQEEKAKSGRFFYFAPPDR